MAGASLAADQNLCETIESSGTRYVVCTSDAPAEQLQLFWQGEDGAPFRTFDAAAKAAQDDGQQMVFAFNAGMYLDDFSPLGLYVEAGDELRPLNTERREGTGASVPNFYKSPNGVFFLTASGAGLLTTEAFASLSPDVTYATQSGPMLVISGELHPAFIEGSTDRKRRTGIGLCADGAVKIAISEQGVNFHDFALFFRDQLGCPDALFLDGGRGAGIYSPALGRNDHSWHGGYGPMIAFIR